MSKKQKLGATGKFPDGKLGEDDQGQLTMGISTKDGNVMIDFGKDINWLAFPPNDAREFARLLIARANGIDMELTV